MVSVYISKVGVVVELTADYGVGPNCSGRGCCMAQESIPVVVVSTLSCGYVAGGRVGVSMESQSNVLSLCTIPQSNKSFAAGGRLSCIYHASSKNAWWLCLIHPD